MHLRDLPIRRKLTLISMLTSGVALFLACTAFIVHERVTFRAAMVRDLSILAQMIGYHSGSALSFDDARAAEQTLKGLAAHPQIVAACIFDQEGEVFATYRAANNSGGPWPAPRADDTVFGRQRLELFRPIQLGEDLVGTIYIQSNLTLMRKRLRRYVTIGAGVMLAATGAAYLIVRRAQRVISGPVSELAAIARTVASEKNYAVRAVKHGNDELGQLIDGFNAMLAQIQARDAALEKARGELEQRVEDRTAELQRAHHESAQHAAQLRFIFEAVPVGVSWVRHHTGESLINEGFFRISGLRRQDLTDIGSIRAISHPDDLKRQDELRAQLDRGETDHLYMEKRYLRADGSVSWAVLTINVFRDPDGRIAQEVSTVVDITERKHAEAERERVQRQLLEISRQAGMAEVATGVLHNVGNVLNSVNVAATLALDRVQASKSGNVAKLGALPAGERRDARRFPHPRSPRPAHPPLRLEPGGRARRRARDAHHRARAAAQAHRAHQGHCRHAAELRQGLGCL